MGIIRSDYLPTDSPKTQRASVHQTTDDTVVYRQEHDVGGILRLNQHLRSEQALHHTSEIMNHVANVDILVLKEWCRQRGIVRRWWMKLFEDDGKLFRTFLNDPENEVWRTRRGKV